MMARKEHGVGREGTPTKRETPGTKDVGDEGSSGITDCGTAVRGQNRRQRANSRARRQSAMPERGQNQRQRANSRARCQSAMRKHQAILGAIKLGAKRRARTKAAEH
jgi:hypothetical protein